MREEELITRELKRALFEYLQLSMADDKGKLIKDTKDYYKNIKPIDRIMIQDKIITDINKEFEYKTKKYLEQRPVPIIMSDELLLGEYYEGQREAFLKDETATLRGSSSIYLRTDESIVLLSIKRDLNSIVYAYNLSDRVMKTAISYAKERNYIFRPDTPSFMLYNKDLIKVSIKADARTIDLVPNDAWTVELAKFAYNEAVSQGYTLNDYSPAFFKNNLEIIKTSLKSGNSSLINVDWKSLTDEQIASLEEYILQNDFDFVIDNRTPLSFKRNIDIVVKSTKLNPESINYADIVYLTRNPQSYVELINKLIEAKYILNESTPEQLRLSSTLVLNSIKLDINSAKYIDERMTRALKQDLDDYAETPEDEEVVDRLLQIRHYLLQNNYYSLEDFIKFDAPVLKDEVALEYYLERMGISKDTSDEESKKYYERVKNFILSCLKIPLKVSDTKKVFHMIALKKWENYRRENTDNYTNIFNRICDSLEKNGNFIEAINELKFLIKVDDVLDERKYALFNAFIEYHQIYHNPNIKNKVELLQAKRNQISEYAALFISKSKEDFISEQIKEFDKAFKSLFIIRTDSPLVKKKVVEVKQRDMLKKMYTNHDTSLQEKLKRIKDKYLNYKFSNPISEDKISHILDLFIKKSIEGNTSSVDEILQTSKPDRFDEYELFEKISKIINRLNSKNITIDSPEATKYHDFISYDGNNYYYSRRPFTEEELSQIKGYKDLKYIFGKVKSEILQIAKSIDSFDKLTQEDIKNTIGECPFTDEYYEFNPNFYDNYIINLFGIYTNMFEDNRQLILDDTYYETINKLLIKEGLFTYVNVTTVGRNRQNDNQGTFKDMDKVCDIDIDTVVSELPSLMTVMEPKDITIDNLSQILEFKDMFMYADLSQISILGKDVIKKIYSNNGFTSSSQKERINVACELISQMISKKDKTVPFVKGDYGNYKYSMYDSTDTTLLTTGLDTNACFRCCGNDNDFLHYCALDKNGFVIKLTDSNGNFIGRASGFRNGNGVYINQLRTIYDKKSSAYDSEKAAIIETFKKACNDIVDVSQNNPDEQNKIDFVVVTKSYSLSDIGSNIDDVTRNAIGTAPMDGTSEDWKNFVANTKNLKEAKQSGRYFTTDFGNYSLICIKSAVGSLSPDKIKKGDVEAVYTRNRKKICTEVANEKIEDYINKIRGIEAYQTNGLFTYLKLPKDSKVVSGDNWYIVYNNEGIVDGRYLNSDEYAKSEYNSYMERILEVSNSIEDSPKKNKR